MSELQPGAVAPSFTLTDLEGDERWLDEIGGDDLLLLVFYHRGGETCQFAMPFVGAMARAIKSPRARIWGVSRDHEDETMLFATAKGLDSMTILLDEPPYKVSEAYGVTTVPTLFLIDGKHTIVKTCAGFSKEDFIEIAAKLARRADVEIPDIFEGAGDIPATKPGGSLSSGG